MVQDLVACQHPIGVGREEGEQAQFERCEMQLAAAHPHVAVQEIDFQLTDGDDWREHHEVLEVCLRFAMTQS